MLELRVRRLYRQDPLRYGFIAEYAACQLTADRLGLPVLAGPVEATALGNVLVQARAALLIDGTLEDLRAIVARSFASTRYLPRHRG